jgi:hypothetical protein
VLALPVDVTHELGEVHAAPMRNLAQFVPENIFKTDAGAMAADDNRPFKHARSQISAVRGILFARPIAI